MADTRTTLRARARAAAPAFLVLLLTLAACSLGTDDRGAVATTASAQTAASTDIGIETVAWGVLGDVVSVLVRNDTDRMLRRGDAVLRVLDTDGRLLTTSATRQDQALCCSARDVPPGATYGFYLAVGAPADRIGRVEIDYVDVAWTSPGAAPTVSGKPLELRRTSSGAEADVELTVPGAPIAQAVVQARIEDADGSLLAIISGRWACLQPGDTRITMGFPRPVPAGTQVASVAVFPLTEATDGASACS